LVGDSTREDKNDDPITIVLAEGYSDWENASMKEKTMKLDLDRIDQTVLALLHLGLHEGSRTWKTFDWDVMSRLHEKGFISDPVGKAKSVAFTDEGLRESERLLQSLFGSSGRE